MEVFLSILSKILVGIFFFGLVGSAIVVIITFFEDGQLLLERDELKAKPETEETIPARTREAF